jgi:UDP-N-acetylmuramate dehydrogenase
MPDAGSALAGLTTLRLGGPARHVTEATDNRQIIQIVREATARREPILILAGGSNVVISDDGFPGLAILIRSSGIDVRADGDDELRVRVAAGEPWDGVVARAVAEGWSGIECLSGIPGSAGATPIQNVGAYGQEIAERIVSVRAYDRHADEIVEFTPGECRFAYRMSIFKHADRWVVLSVDLRLRRSRASAPIRYAELAAALGVEIGQVADAGAVRDVVRALRAGKGMVLDPDDKDTWSVGSFFTNPVVSGERWASLGLESAPHWPGEDGTVKIPAAWLIEHAGFPKGFAGDGVAISSKHTLALTNRGPASTAGLLALARTIRDGVRSRFGLDLHPEPVLVNCSLEG